MDQNLISVREVTLKKDLFYNGVKLLTYQIHYPEFYSFHFEVCLTRVNQFYKNKAYEYMRYCETTLFNMAIMQYKEDQKNDYPVRVFDIVQIYEVTYIQSCIISLFVDRYEYTGGAHGNTARNSQTWQLQNCIFLRLHQLAGCLPDYKTYLLTEIERQIDKEPELVFNNYKELIAKTFNKRNFYCTPDGIVFYYQQYDIAPYSSGIREFPIPYSSCVINPVSYCE